MKRQKKKTVAVASPKMSFPWFSIAMLGFGLWLVLSMTLSSQPLDAPRSMAKGGTATGGQLLFIGSLIITSSLFSLSRRRIKKEPIRPLEATRGK